MTTLAFLNWTSQGDGGLQIHESSGSGSVDVSTVRSPSNTKPDSPGWNEFQLQLDNAFCETFTLHVFTHKITRMPASLRTDPLILSRVKLNDSDWNNQSSHLCLINNVTVICIASPITANKIIIAIPDRRTHANSALNQCIVKYKRFIIAWELFSIQFPRRLKGCALCTLWHIKFAWATIKLSNIGMIWRRNEVDKTFFGNKDPLRECN